MAGNTSTYRIITDRRTNTPYFIKTVKASSFNFSSLEFQKKLYDNFINKIFKIVRPIDSTETADGMVHIKYEVIDEKKWEITADNVSDIGKGLAQLHNFCYEEKELASIWQSEKVNATTMDKWEEVPMSKDKTIATDLRHGIYGTLKPYRGQVKIPVHRDFKIHNILNNGQDFYLIDFDFAEVDNVCLELVAFMIDLYYNTQSLQIAESFIKAYKQECRIPIDWSSALNDYLVYMCCNTFPFYMRETIGEDNFRALFDERNHKLYFAYSNKDLINENLSR